MAIDRAAERRGVAETLREDGSLVTVRKPTWIANPSGAGRVRSAPTDYTVPALVTSFGAKEVNGSTIRSGDSKVLLAALTSAFAEYPALTPDDQILFDGKVLEVIDPGPVLGDGITIVYKCHAAAHKGDRGQSITLGNQA